MSPPTTPYRQPGKPPHASCSFCGKPQEQVRKLVAGPSVFICDECVGLCKEILAAEDAKAHPKPTRSEPRSRSEVAALFDERVVGCAEAKRALTAALLEHALDTNPGRAPRVLLVGPLGSGKTTLGHAACAAASSPTCAINVGRMSESGYIGEDALHALLGLVDAAGGDVARAARGLLFLDGVEKLEARRPHGDGRDLTGENVQRELHPILDGALIDLSRRTRELSVLDTTRVMVIAAVRCSAPPAELHPTTVRRTLAQLGLLDSFVSRFDTVVRVPALGMDDARALTEERLARTNAMLAELSSRLDLTADAIARLSEAASGGAGGWAIQSVFDAMLEEILVLDQPPPLVRRDAASLQQLVGAA
ncbi:MAG: ClpX C4-type zinc finger protein [Polyangiaceae bacterium]